MHAKALCLTLICLAITPTAVAADKFTTKYHSYISLNTGRSNAPGTCAYLYAAGATCSEKGTVFRLGYGYQFTDNWGLEVSYGDFGRAKEKGILPSTPSGVPGSGPIPYTWEWGGEGWEIAGTGTLRFGDSLSLTGKLGVLRANLGTEIIVTTSTNEIWHAVTHDASSSVSKGLGIRYDFNRDVALRLKYEDYGKLGSTTKIKTSAVHMDLLLKF